MTDGRRHLVFLGTPDFAVPTLRALFENKHYAVDAVITQPDKPAGRGQHLTPPPVKVLAAEFGVPVFQPISLKPLSATETLTDTLYKKPVIKGEKSSEALADFLNSLSAIDALVTVAYGKIIPHSLLYLARFGVINIHPSALPRWRGAAPLQHTLFSRDTETEICIMRADEGLDTGGVFYRQKYPITPEDTFGDLHQRFSVEGAALLLQALPRIFKGELLPQPQTESGATYAEKWEKKDLEINWKEPTETTLARIRASNPVPGARTHLKDEQVKIYAAHRVADRSYPLKEPGTVVAVNLAEIVVSTGDSGFISLDEIQFPGKKRLPVAEVLKGRNIDIGELFKSGDESE